MLKPNLRAVDNNQPHARDIARAAVKEWRSNADKEELPIATVQDSGAPSLRVDDVIRRSQPDLIGKKAPR